jgi:glyoxylase-like metal-dependent hydrolase (beta-lactamase superfamily II)
MPHGSIRIGDIEITALCDVVQDSWPLDETFPDVPPGEWTAVRDRYPGTVGVNNLWRFHVHCFLVRSPDRVLLVDTGVGPRDALFARELNADGSLLDELEVVGVDPRDVRIVATTHLHPDHIGWNVTGTDPLFANATYLIGATEWTAFREAGPPEDRAERDRLVFSLRDAGLLELVANERELAEGVRIVPTPGHTPGSQSLLVESDQDRAWLSGDVANHPVQIDHPSWRSDADADPGIAGRTRSSVFRRVEDERMILCTAHFPEPFGRIADGRWQPMSTD